MATRQSFRGGSGNHFERYKPYNASRVRQSKHDTMAPRITQDCLVSPARKCDELLQDLNNDKEIILRLLVNVVQSSEECRGLCSEAAKIGESDDLLMLKEAQRQFEELHKKLTQSNTESDKLSEKCSDFKRRLMDHKRRSSLVNKKHQSLREQLNSPKNVMKRPKLQGVAARSPLTQFRVAELERSLNSIKDEKVVLESQFSLYQPELENLIRIETQLRKVVEEMQTYYFSALHEMQKQRQKLLSNAISRKEVVRKKPPKPLHRNVHLKSSQSPQSSEKLETMRNVAAVQLKRELSRARSDVIINGKLKENKEGLEQRNKELEIKVKQLQSALTECTRLSFKYQEQLSETNRQVAQKEEQFADQTRELDKRSENEKRLAAELVKAEEQVKSAHLLITQKDTELKGCHEKCNKLKSQLGKSSRKAASAQECDELTRCQERLEEMNAKHGSVCSENSHLKEQLQELKDAYHSERQIGSDSHQQRYEELEMNYVKLKKNYKMLENAHEHLVSNNVDLNKEHELLQKKYSDLTKHYELSEQKHETLQNNYELSETMYKDVKLKYENVKKKHKHLDEKCNNLEGDLIRLKKYENLEKNDELLRKKHKELNEEYMKVQARCEQVCGEKSNIENQLQNLTAAYESLKEKCEELQNILLKHEEVSFKFTNAFTSAGEGSVLDVSKRYRHLHHNTRAAAARAVKKVYKVDARRHMCQQITCAYEIAKSRVLAEANECIKNSLLELRSSEEVSPEQELLHACMVLISYIQADKDVKTAAVNQIQMELMARSTGEFNTTEQLLPKDVKDYYRSIAELTWCAVARPIPMIVAESPDTYCKPCHELKDDDAEVEDGQQVSYVYPVLYSSNEWPRQVAQVGKVVLRNRTN